MAARPTVAVQSIEGKASGNVALPAVMSTPLRNDIIKYVTMQLLKNKRQANGTDRRAGHKHSAESWGTGRAVSRIPRVSGGGTHATGAGAFGNMARGGHMFSMKKVFRRWQVAVPRKLRRFAVASAIAATAVAPLVAARGHKIDAVAEVPIVVDDAIEKISKTKDAVKLLKAVNVYDDAVRAALTKLRAGKGKYRNRRRITRKGPLIVVKDTSAAQAAFRNLPGIKAVSVSRLNVLDLAPGGHVGRLVVWSKSAFAELDAIYGTTSDAAAPQKAKFVIPRTIMTNADVTSVVARDEIQSVLRPKKKRHTKAIRNVNPLKSIKALAKLDPVAASKRASVRNAKALPKNRMVRVVLSFLCILLALFLVCCIQFLTPGSSQGCLCRSHPQVQVRCFCYVGDDSWWKVGVSS